MADANTPRLVRSGLKQGGFRFDCVGLAVATGVLGLERFTVKKNPSALWTDVSLHDHFTLDGSGNPARAERLSQGR